MSVTMGKDLYKGVIGDPRGVGVKTSVPTALSSQETWTGPSASTLGPSSRSTGCHSDPVPLLSFLPLPPYRPSLSDTRSTLFFWFCLRLSLRRRSVTVLISSPFSDLLGLRLFTCVFELFGRRSSSPRPGPLSALLPFLSSSSPGLDPRKEGVVRRREGCPWLP